MQKFPQELQTPLYHKEKTFSEFFIAFPKYKSNLKDFIKKDESHSLSISEIIDSKRGRHLNV